MSDTFTVVERPSIVSTRGFQPSSETSEVVNTYHTGKAVEIRLAGRSLAGVRGKLSGALKRRGLSLRSVFDGHKLTAWAIKRGES